MTEAGFLNAILYTALGVTAFVVAFAILIKLAPFHMWKEVVQERNIAVAILAGAVALGLCWIVAATMH
jgi:putative membrane protein